MVFFPSLLSFIETRREKTLTLTVYVLYVDIKWCTQINGQDNWYESNSMAMSHGVTLVLWFRIPSSHIVWTFRNSEVPCDSCHFISSSNLRDNGWDHAKKRHFFLKSYTLEIDHPTWTGILWRDLGVSKNRGTYPQIHGILIGFSIIFTIHFGGKIPPIFGNIHFC